MKTRAWLLALSLLLSLGTPVAAAEKAAPKSAEAKTDTYELLNLFGDVFERIRSDYVEAPSDEELIEAAVNGMLTSLDPHSSYLNAKRYSDMKVQTQGQFGGLGLEVTMDGGFVKVVSPIDDTPAYRAGIEAGDLITQIDGQSVQGMTLADAVEKMRGEVGTDVKLLIRRTGRDPFEVTLTRAIIKLKSVRSRLEGNIGYIRISSFTEQTEVGLQEAIKKLNQEAKGELQGIVLDLRNNPGGLLSQAVAVSDAFLERGEIVSTRARKPDDSQRFNARPGDIAKGLPIVVLINGGSASASEIVAGALQDQGRAIVLGTKSFGKGSVQTIVPLGSHGAMRLTTSRYYTPSGRSIQAVGIEPDILVEQARIETIAQSQGRREADLPGALKNDENGTPAEPAKPEDGKTPSSEKPDEKKDEKKDEKASQPADEKEAAARDYQLQRALDLLRGLALYTAREDPAKPKTVH